MSHYDHKSIPGAKYESNIRGKFFHFVNSLGRLDDKSTTATPRIDQFC